MYYSFSLIFFSKEICTGQFEEFKAEGTACQPTCDNRNPGCTKNYVSGCFCIPGYIRNKYNKCIPIKNCRKIFFSIKTNKFNYQKNVPQIELTIFVHIFQIGSH